MHIDIVTIFPQMFAAITDYGVCARAIQSGLVDLSLWNPRDYSTDKHRRVDDRPYGGGPGMVMQAEPLARAIEDAQRASGGNTSVIYLSPQGALLDHQKVMELADRKKLVLLAGRYEGVDQRLLDAYVDEELSIGDYVLSGGELAAMVVIEAVVRQLPGVLGNEESAEQDSFVRGLLDCAHFTRPEVYAGQTVPEVLLSGNHGAVSRWRLKQSLGATWLKRSDLLDQLQLNPEQQTLLKEFKKEHLQSETTS